MHLRARYEERQSVQAAVGLHQLKTKAFRQYIESQSLRQLF